MAVTAVLEQVLPPAQMRQRQAQAGLAATAAAVAAAAERSPTAMGLMTSTEMADVLELEGWQGMGHLDLP